MNEAARVLYVAATRAKRRLHWVGVAERDSITHELREPSANTPLASLWPAFCREARCIDLAAEASENQSGALAGFVPKLVRRQLIPVAVARELLAAEVAQIAPEVDEVPETRFSAAVGTLVHACLEQIAADPVAWDVTRVTNAQGNFARWLELRGWPALESSRGAQRAVTMLQTTLASDAGRWILGTRSDAAAELALAKVGAGGTAQVRVVDRCFIADGTRWIIDYKTAALGDCPSMTALQQHAARYQTQLASYAELFAGEGLPVCCAVFYVAYGKLVVLD
jgi:ATP-dependent exoDNAse (exonuclease V) beta subunit